MMRWTSVAWVSLFVCLLGIGSVFAAIPEILEIGPEEALPTGLGRLSSIACDAKNQPHIACDGGTSVYFYDKINGVWQNSAYNVTAFGWRQFFNPRLEIDNTDRAWASGIAIFPIGVIQRGNISTAPSTPGVSSWYVNPASWDTGNLSIDLPLGHVTAYSSAGNWQTRVYNASVAGGAQLLEKGVMYCGVGGEANTIHISRAGLLQHANGKLQSVWHVATEAHAGYGYSYYQNSARFARGQPSVGWADPRYYTGMGKDGAYVSCYGDNKEQEIAYIACDLTYDNGQGGVYANVFHKTAMVYPVTSMYVVDRTGTSGLRRYAPQWAPAKGGGAFIAWVNSGRIKIRYFGQDGKPGPVQDICYGTVPNLTCDSKGDIHLSYNNGGMKYRKLNVSGSGSGLVYVPAADFNNDNKDDLCVYDPVTSAWWIRTLTGTVLCGGTPFGYTGVIPMGADFNGDGSAETAVYDPATGKWYARTLSGTTVLNGRQWGFPNVYPCPADYNGDGAAELGVYEPITGMWFIQSAANESYYWVQQWGYAGTVPLPADYDGDGKAELCVYDPSTQMWYIQKFLSSTAWQVQLGMSSTVPMPGNYDGDPTGSADLAAFDLNTGNWYIRTLAGASIVWGRNWGFLGSMPVTGDYDGGGSELGVWNPNTGDWYIQSITNPGNVTQVNWGYPGVIPTGSWY